VLFSDVLLYPVSKMTARYERLGWNQKTGNAVKNKLLGKGLVRVENVTTPHGRVRILSLTDSGEVRAREYGHEFPPGRRASVEHEFWKVELAGQLEGLGFSVEVEYALGDGLSVDLCAVRGDLRLFVEVETGKSDVVGNVRKCARVGGVVLFFFTSQKVFRKFQSLFEQLGNPRMQSCGPKDWPRMLERLSGGDLPSS